MSIFKACDIRGIFGQELQISHATALAHALVLYTKPTTVLVGGDGRLSTPALKEALTRTLAECGVHVLDVGRVPTPVYYYARRKLGIEIGVMVTGSHNPPADNGFKLALSNLPITEQKLAEIRSLMESGARAPQTNTGTVERIPVVDDYVAFVKNLFPARGQLRIVLDTGNGVMGPVAPRVFRRLGYEIDELFTEVDGHFPNRSPNPAIASNISALQEQVCASQAAFGVAYDGDGDRAAFVDEHGDTVDNDRIIVLLARQGLAQRPGSAIVYDQKCSDIVREEIERGGGIPYREKSGHTFIKSTFLSTGAAYAGELSGHHFFAELGGDDGLVASLKLAVLIQTSGESLAQRVARIPRYPITPDIRLHVEPKQGQAILLAIKQNLRGALELSEIDGVRAQFAEGWGMVRASVTEPAITLRFEGHTREALENIKREFVRAAPQLAGRL